MIHLRSFAERVDLENVLTYRPKAEEMYKLAIPTVEPLSDGDIIECSFLGIDSCDVSFVDQFLINFQLHLSTHKNVLMRISHSNSDINENIEAALAWRNKKNKEHICILTYDSGKYGILGELEKNLLDTFSLFTYKQQVLARDVVDSFGIEINGASNRLKKLFDANLLLRKELIDVNGRQHIYYLL
jgi:hypothetical protein